MNKKGPGQKLGADVGGGCWEGARTGSTGSEREANGKTEPRCQHGVLTGRNGKEQQENGKLVFDEVVVEKLPLAPAAGA